jgi:hypothetical protein
MTPNTLHLPDVASRGDKAAARRVAHWLAFGAAPTFAAMAALAGLLGGGAHELSCSTDPHTVALSGMVPMYMLMSAFHLAPWLKLISRGVGRVESRR